jgi:hypothetical protein
MQRHSKSGMDERKVKKKRQKNGQKSGGVGEFLRKEADRDREASRIQMIVPTLDLRACPLGTGPKSNHEAKWNQILGER